MGANYGMARPHAVWEYFGCLKNEVMIYPDWPFPLPLSDLLW